MTRIINEITISAPIEKVWSILANPELLDQYDPTVKKSTLISDERTGQGAKRKVTMLDGRTGLKKR